MFGNGRISPAATAHVIWTQARQTGAWLLLCSSSEQCWCCPSVDMLVRPTWTRYSSLHPGPHGQNCLSYSPERCHYTSDQLFKYFRILAPQNIIKAESAHPGAPQYEFYLAYSAAAAGKHLQCAKQGAACFMNLISFDLQRPSF